MHAKLSLVALCSLLLPIPEQLTADELHPAKKILLGGIPYGTIVNQLVCDDGKLVWRQFNGRQINNGQIVSVDLNGLQPALENLTPDLLPKGAQYSISDFIVKAGYAYLATRSFEHTYVLRYNLAAHKFEDPIQLDDRGSNALADGQLMLSKVSVLPDGALLALGIRATRSENGDSHYTPVLELYTQTGRFIKSTDWGKDRPTVLYQENGKATFDSRNIDLATISAGPDGAYLGISAGKNKVTIVRVSAAGELEKALDVNLPDGHRHVGMQVVNNQLLLETVPDANQYSNSSGAQSMSQFLVYSISTGDLLSRYEAPSSLGAFGCFDGRRQFTFVSTGELGQRFLVTAEP